MMSDNLTRPQVFANMSAVLTGFLPSVIAPQLDPIGLNALYLETADAQAGATLVDQLLAWFQSLDGQPPQQIADTLLATTNPDPPQTAWLARSIVKMWYLGSWFPAEAPAPGQASNVVSANAYIGGLAWRAAQAHPMGYSELTFGYWASAPPSLAQFGVGTPQKGEGNG